MTAARQRSYPSTNALGSAKVDCHTCKHLGQHCDRQRPQCGTCRRKQRHCGGFAMDIKWSKQIPQPLQPELSPQQGLDELPRPIRFVTTAPRRRRKARLAPSDAQRLMTTFSAIETTDTPAQRLPLDEEPQVDDRSEEDSPDYLETSFPDASWSTSGFHVAVSTPDESFFMDNNDTSSFDVSLVPLNHSTMLGWASSNYSHLEDSPFSSFPLSPGVQYSSFANKVAAVLDMYDQEFCVLPLSEDCRSNPFRVRRETCEGSAFLLHAVLALASQHLAKKNNCVEMTTQMHNHQATAVKLFSEAVAYTPAFTALDTLLLLVNFEATQTASSTWAVHLGGAYNIIESIGIDVVCQRSSRTRAQIAMLVWWDVTIALISRKPPRFPMTYLETLLQYSGEDGWTWVSLNGCPAELVSYMARLARLASTYEKVLDMEWTSFDHTPVRSIITEVRQWKNLDGIDEHDFLSAVPPQSAPDEDPNQRLNRLHCTEAWRQGILLYAHRIFFRDLDPALRHRSIAHFSRVVLDHVRCIPPSAIVQKQTLLPVFLAGAEARSEATRSFVRDYCHHWSVTARYNMFASVGTLLERVWARATTDLDGQYWWGCSVGETDFTGSPDDDDDDQLLVSELLLG